jgi:hypothetical protein
MPDMHPVNSSNLAAVGWEDGEIFIQFRNGATYKCVGTEAEMLELRGNPTAKKGEFFDTVIKPRLRIA